MCVRQSSGLKRDTPGYPVRRGTLSTTPLHSTPVMKNHISDVTISESWIAIWHLNCLRLRYHWRMILFYANGPHTRFKRFQLKHSSALQGLSSPHLKGNSMVKLALYVIVIRYFIFTFIVFLLFPYWFLFFHIHFA